MTGNWREATGNGREFRRNSREINGKWREIDGNAREIDRKRREIDGKWREIDGNAREIDGTWREIDGTWREIDGKWREIDGKPREIEPPAADTPSKTLCWLRSPPTDPFCRKGPSPAKPFRTGTPPTEHFFWGAPKLPFNCNKPPPAKTCWGSPPTLKKSCCPGRRPTANTFCWSNPFAETNPWWPDPVQASRPMPFPATTPPDPQWPPAPGPNENIDACDVIELPQPAAPERSPWSLPPPPNKSVRPPNQPLGPEVFCWLSPNYSPRAPSKLEEDIFNLERSPWPPPRVDHPRSLPRDSRASGPSGTCTSARRSKSLKQRSPFATVTGIWDKVMGGEQLLGTESSTPPTTESLVPWPKSKAFIELSSCHNFKFSSATIRVMWSCRTSSRGTWEPKPSGIAASAGREPSRRSLFWSTGRDADLIAFKANSSLALSVQNGFPSVEAAAVVAIPTGPKTTGSPFGPS